MAYNNFNEYEKENLPPQDVTNQTAPLQNKDNNSKLGRNLLFGLLGLGVLGGVGYGGYKYSENSNNKTREAFTKEQLVKGDSILTEKDKLQGQFDAINYKLDSMSGSNSAMGQTISNKNGEIAKLKDEIRTLLAKVRNNSATESENNRLKKALAELQSKTNNLEEQLAGLKTENANLTTQNQQITLQKEQVTQERDVAIKTTADLEANKKQLEEKIDIGSTLTASNFDMSGINVKRNGKEKSSSTAAKIDKLKITFTIAENKITTPGEKEMYLIVNDPNGIPLAVEALGSGKLTTRDSQQKIFTKKFNINYTPGASIPVTVLWEQEADYKKGDYTFEIYQNGFKIGSGKKYLERKKVLGIF